MRCPYCRSDKDKVVNSRVCQEGDAIRRRRECLDCGKRFTTFEHIEPAQIHIIKRNGQRQPFDRAKLKQKIWRACEKRSVTDEDVEGIVANIEKDVHNRMQSEIEAVEIGELVLKYLRDLDEVAYVRFASVYRDFRDVSQFRDEAQNLLKKKD